MIEIKKQQKFITNFKIQIQYTQQSKQQNSEENIRKSVHLLNQNQLDLLKSNNPNNISLYQLDYHYQNNQILSNHINKYQENRIVRKMYVFSPIFRFILCLIPYIILVSNKQLIYYISGQITIPPFDQSKTPLVWWIFAIQSFRVFYTPIISFIFKISKSRQIQLYYKHGSNYYNQQQQSIFHKMTTKYIIVLIMKLFILFYEFHRLKYYLTVFFIQLFITAINILADVVHNEKVSLVMDIVMIDALNRVAIFYQLTRTFNPNFGLYFFGNNLITLLCYLLQGDRKQVLYVRHDIYRIMIVTMGYIFLFSLFQLSITYKPLLIFILSGYFFYQTINQFSSQHIAIEQQKNKNKQEYKVRHNMRGWYNDIDMINRLNRGRQNKSIISIVNMIKRIPLGLKRLVNYIRQIRNKKALINFYIVVLITISVEFLFIYNQVSQINQKGKISIQGQDQIVPNNFIQYIKNINQSLRLNNELDIQNANHSIFSMINSTNN